MSIQKYHSEPLPPLQEEDLNDEAQADDRDEEDDKGFHLPDAQPLNRQQQEHISAGDEHGPDQRHAVPAEHAKLRGQQSQPDRRAKHFGQVARANGDLAEDKQNPPHGGAVAVAARLRKILTSYQSQAR